MRAVREGGEPWEADHPFDRREPLTPHEVYEFRIELGPTGYLFRPGERLALRISSSDVEPLTAGLDIVGAGRLLRSDPSWQTVHHNEDQPSRLDVPITSGNVVGTFLSGGELPLAQGW